MRAAKLVAAAALVLVSIVGLAWQSEVRDSNETTVAEAARRLLEIDAHLDRAVLESQAGLSLNYDEIASTERELLHAFEQMEVAAAQIDDARLSALVSVARGQVLQRERLADSFESLNSVFRNSAAFLPVAAKQATALASAGEPGEVARHLVAELLEDVLVCRAGCTHETLDQVGDDVAALSAASSELPTDERREFQVVLRHARLFYQYAPKLEAAVRALVRMDTRAYAEIGATARDRREHARRQANYYRTALAVVCVGLVSALVLAAGRLRRGALALEKALRSLRQESDALVSKQLELAGLNHELESRVAHRTNDLVRSRDQYRLLVETTQAIPFEIESSSQSFRYLGPQAASLLGFSIGECTASGFLAAHVHSDDRDAVLQAFSPEAVNARGEIEFRIATSSGHWIWLRAFTTRLVGESESILRGVLLDATTQRELEASLRAAQKLESIGRLASGIAHEINTPVQFISDNVGFLRDATTTFTELLSSYRGKYVDLALRQQEKDAELDYLLDEVPRALTSSQEGLERVANIVRAMKGFAHPGHTTKSAADLNMSIRNTLTLARSQYAMVAVIKTDLGDLPPVHCHAGEINQVILNLITNAAHAIADVVAITGRMGEITVRTWRDEDDVVVSVRDTGGGIPVEHREKLFDPFFTTKDVGSGTGQGLAIARSLIVDKHGGAITFDSEVGRGSEFRIRLPIGRRADRGPPLESAVA